MSSLRWKIAQWFELRWWQRYFSGKDKTQYYDWKKNYWRGLVAQIADVLPPTAARIADLGCGPAGIFTVYGDSETVALDPLLDTYASTLSFFDKSDFPNTTFVNSALEDFQTDHKFDIVFCMNAINHVADIDRAYDRMIDAAKQGGDVVVSIDAHNHSFFKHLFRLIPGDILHPHQYELQEYCDFMTQRGCSISKTLLVKKEFFFSHYVVVGRKKNSSE